MWFACAGINALVYMYLYSIMFQVSILECRSKSLRPPSMDGLEQITQLRFNS